MITSIVPSNYRTGPRSSQFGLLKHSQGYRRRKPPHNRAPISQVGNFAGRNYRQLPSAFRRDFISKISVVTEETDETLFWFELLIESELIGSAGLQPMMLECEELLKVFSASLATAKRNR